MTFEAFVEVRRHPGIADPEGATIERALPTLGFAGVTDVSVGKAFRLTVEAADEAAARTLHPPHQPHFGGSTTTAVVDPPKSRGPRRRGCRASRPSSGR